MRLPSDQIHRNEGSYSITRDVHLGFDGERGTRRRLSASACNEAIVVLS
ncbi:hypothetical protein SAMN07250955_105262 [Arboricoccus pini]|uniref:Uncharacterized protein n=1 Tax=Arboricoccus pini TaxID=1963835 RepID=A0A212R5D2_9PROT|nr:hypothetical protein SAMN07250955_105262 [Arboricoccus pini]